MDLIKHLIHGIHKGTLYIISFFFTILIVSCDINEKKAKRIVEAASDLSIEKLCRLDSLISIYGDSTHCLRVGFVFSDEESDDSVKKANDVLQPYYNDYKANHYDTIPRDNLLLKTLFWFNNGTPFDVAVNNSQQFWHRNGLYKYEDGDLYQLMNADSIFKFEFIKDMELLNNYFEVRGYVFEQGYLDAIKEIDKVQYITFVENVCEKEPSGGMPFFTSGGILSRVKVFEMESGYLIKSMSVYAANSDSLSFTPSRHRNNFEIENEVMMQNLLTNHWRMMVRQLNTICP